jgi:hypothetical protein
VGKTAIAEGLAQRIVSGDVPESLKVRAFYSLDICTYYVLHVQRLSSVLVVVYIV